MSSTKNRIPIPGLLLLVVFFLGLPVLSGCGHETDRPQENLQPELRITGGPLDGDTDSYTARVFWTGWDEDGVIDHYEYAVDPPLAFTDFEIAHPESASNVAAGVTIELVPGPAEDLDTLRVSKDFNGTRVSFDWVQTLDFSRSFVFNTPNPDSALTEPISQYSGAHSVYVRCVDNEDYYSKFDRIGYTATTITPEAEIVRPNIEAQVLNFGSTFTVTWDGVDVDAPDVNKKPIGYVYHLLRLDTLEPPISILFVQNPNILYDQWNEGSDSTWTYQDADTLEKTFLLGVPGQYVFGVRAVDIAGAEEPFLEFGRNAFRFEAFPQGGFPSLTITEPTVGTDTFRGQSRVLNAEVATGAKLRFRWTANADAYGGRIDGFSFGVDIPDLDREGPDSGWSGWGPTTGNFEPISFDRPGIHVLYVRVRDDAGSITLATIVLNVVEFTFARELLFIDDSRENSTTPRDTEHDAFWNNLIINNGTLGEPFSFPVFGESETSLSPRSIPLEELGKYKLVIVENHGTAGPSPGVTGLFQMTVKSPKLAAYLGAGGKLWVGGRATLAAMWRTGSSGTNSEYPLELRPGDFSWDFLKLHSTEVRNDKGIVGGVNTLVQAVPFPGKPVIYDHLFIDKSKLNPVLAGLGGVTHADAVWDPNFAGQELGFQGVIDSLYVYGAAGPLDSLVYNPPRSSSYQNRLMATRWHDPDPNRIHGRVQWFGFPLYYFNDDECQRVFDKSIEWFREEQVGVN